MKNLPILSVLILSLMLVASPFRSALAVELNVWATPITTEIYDPIDRESVRVDAIARPDVPPAQAWLAQVGKRNKDLMDGFDVRAVAAIEVTLVDVDNGAESSEPFIAEARRWGARFGANVVYLDKQLAQDNKFSGMHFTGYRITYKERLISPTYIAGLPFVKVPESVLEEQLASWEAAHVGTVHVSIASLSTLKDGTSVRLILKDGSDLKGSFSGIDDDNMVWIHTKGWKSLLRDHAIPTRNIQTIALLN